MSKIDDKTSIPLFAATTLLLFAVGGAWTTAGLLSDMKSDIRDLKKDVRLIKKHDHIPDVEEAESRAPLLPPLFVEPAEAKAKR